MDTRFSDEDLAFRDEVRAFLGEAYTDDIVADLQHPSSYKAAIVRWQKKPGTKG